MQKSDFTTEARIVCLRASHELMKAGAYAIGSFDPVQHAAEVASWIAAGADSREQHARLEAVRICGRYRAAANLCVAQRFIAEAAPLVRFLLDATPPRSRKPGGLPEAA